MHTRGASRYGHSDIIQGIILYAGRHQAVNALAGQTTSQCVIDLLHIALCVCETVPKGHPVLMLAESLSDVGINVDKRVLEHERKVGAIQRICWKFKQ